MTDHFGELLRNAREAAGMSRTALGQQAGLDPSHIYRLESGTRRPSPASTLTLAEILRLDQTTINHWLIAAGFAPLPNFAGKPPPFRVRGGPPGEDAERGEVNSPSHLVDWADWLEEMGLDDKLLKQMQHTMSQVSLPERKQIASAVRTLLARVVCAGEISVHTAVIAATAAPYRLLAAPLLQQMLLHTVREAADAGLTNIVAILPAGTTEAIFQPLQDIFDLAALRVRSIEAASDEGLGEALLRGEDQLGHANFAVLTPVPVGMGLSSAEKTGSVMGRLLDVFTRQQAAATIAVRVVSQRAISSRLSAGLPGQPLSARLIQLGVQNEAGNRDTATSQRSYRMTGRCVLQPTIFEALRRLRTSGGRPRLLRDALAQLGAEGQSVYGLVVSSAHSQDAFLRTILQDYI